MKTYRLYRNDEPGGWVEVAGKTLDEAVDKDFGKIAGRWRLGNVAGFRVVSAKVDYDEDAKRGAVTIEHQGSESIVGYDWDKKVMDEADEIKVLTLYCETEPVDVPGGHIDIEIGREKLFDPFDDACLDYPGQAGQEVLYGTVIGLIDYLYTDRTNRVKTTPHSFWPSEAATDRNPNARQVAPAQYIQMCLGYIDKGCVSPDGGSARIMARISELIGRIDLVGFRPSRGIDDIYQAKTDNYFKKKKIPSKLRELRKKAGLSQAELAERVGVSQTFIAKYEKPGADLEDIAARTYKRIALELGVPFDRL